MTKAMRALSTGRGADGLGPQWPFHTAKSAGFGRKRKGIFG
jgi:hypothetical protein